MSCYHLVVVVINDMKTCRFVDPVGLDAPQSFLVLLDFCMVPVI